MPVPVVKVSIEEMKSNLNSAVEAKSYFDSLVDIHQKNTKNSSLEYSVRAAQAALQLALRKMDEHDQELYQSVLEEYNLLNPALNQVKNNSSRQINKNKILAALATLSDEEINQFMIERQKSKIRVLIEEKIELQKKINLLNNKIEELTGRSAEDVEKTFFDDEVLSATKKICNNDPMCRTPCSVSDIHSDISNKFPQWTKATLKKKITETLDNLSQKNIVSKTNSHYFVIG